MGILVKLLVLGTAFLAVWSSYKVFIMLQPSPVPHLEEKYWGPGSPKPDDVTVKPFKINISEEALQDLQKRLASTRKPVPALEGVAFKYGFHSAMLDTVLDFWRTKYDWREREAVLNSIPQFTTQVQGLRLHLLHAKPRAGVRSMPLLVLHGWPGSVREFYELVPRLTKPIPGADFAFEVIAPSLPGYAWSEGAAKPGMSAAHVAVVFKNLMARLGHSEFYVHGGDWGAIIGSAMATLFPGRVLGLHSTMCVSQTPMAKFKTLIGALMPDLVVDKARRFKMYPLSTMASILLEEFGYMHLQATKPDTVGVALTDSPAGLAAYVLEKFGIWTDGRFKHMDDGGLTKRFALEDLLDNVMVYWFSRSITTSMRLYAEYFTVANRALDMEATLTTVPTACARFRNEFFWQSDTILKEKFVNLVRSTDFDEGGHFSAFELPHLVAKDLWEAIIQMELRRASQ